MNNKNVWCNSCWIVIPIQEGLCVHMYWLIYSAISCTLMNKKWQKKKQQLYLSRQVRIFSFVCIPYTFTFCFYLF